MDVSDEGAAVKPTALKRPMLVDSSDDESEAKTARREPTSVIPDITDASFSAGLLRLYYDKFFPYEHMFNWLSYFQDPASDDAWIERDYFARREMSFTIGEVYMRFLTFNNLSEFRKGIKDKQPHKIDIGAVYTHQASRHTTAKKGTFFPLQRELVFDIDLTDYDDVRTCCSGATICRRCWGYMNVAITVLDEGLREDFGFQHIMWIYSGRRGVHCWVVDESARKLSNRERTAIVEYFSAVSGGSDESSKRASLTTPLVPAFSRAFDALEPFFVESVITEDGQRILTDRKNWHLILKLVPNLYGLPEKAKAIFEKDKEPADKWEDLKDAIRRAQGKLKPTDHEARRQLSQAIPEIVFVFCYPRIDENVTKGMNHLLKSPFCVHPKTGRVCVAIDPVKASSFDPFAVPTLGDLAKDVNAGKDASSSSMAPYIQTFAQFLAGLKARLDGDRRIRAREFKDRHAHSTGDW